MIHFFLGTEAELIKVFSVMLSLKKKGVDYNFVASGQHKLEKSEVLEMFSLKKPDRTLYGGPQFTSPLKMFLWGFKMVLLSQEELNRVFKNDRNGIVIVHGDTISTVIGAILAKRKGLKVAHIEAGMWSHNLLQPFPEELDRRIVSALADLNFCPAESGYKNLISYKNKKVLRTINNTQLDAFILIKRLLPKIVIPTLPKKYFIFILHRTENLINRELVKELTMLIMNESQKIKCIFILHHTTIQTLKNLRLWDQLNKNNNIIKMPKLKYSQFVKILSYAEFIATDGGGNQMEGAYLGLPTLILRKLSESPEGIGENVVISKLDYKIIDDFFSNYKRFRRHPIEIGISPTDIIAQELLKEF